jgi:hypothetical protein
MKDEGYRGFTMHDHSELWKRMGAKTIEGKYGVTVAGKSWLWYPSWIDEVRKYCKENEHRYKPTLAFAQNSHPALQALAAEGEPILV